MIADRRLFLNIVYVYCAQCDARRGMDMLMLVMLNG